MDKETKKLARRIEAEFGERFRLDTAYNVVYELQCGAYHYYCQLTSENLQKLLDFGCLEFDMTAN